MGNAVLCILETKRGQGNVLPQIVRTVQKSALVGNIEF